MESEAGELRRFCSWIGRKGVSTTNAGQHVTRRGWRNEEIKTDNTEAGRTH
jgi:hypothetical protein